MSSPRTATVLPADPTPDTQNNQSVLERGNRPRHGDHWLRVTEGRSQDSNSGLLDAKHELISTQPGCLLGPQSLSSWGPSHWLPGVAQRRSQGVSLGDVFPSLTLERLAHRAAVGTKCDHRECTLGPGIAGIAGTRPPPILQMGTQRNRHGGSHASESSSTFHEGCSHHDGNRSMNKCC